MSNTGTVTNSNTILASSGSNVLSAPAEFVNNGLIGVIDGATETVSAPLLSGTGTLEISSDGHLFLNAGSIQPTQAIVFTDATGLLTIDSNTIGGFNAVIGSFQAGDQITVLTTAAATFSQSGSIVSVVASGVTLGHEGGRGRGLAPLIRSFVAAAYHLLHHPHQPIQQRRVRHIETSRQRLRRDALVQVERVHAVLRHQQFSRENVGNQLALAARIVGHTDAQLLLQRVLAAIGRETFLDIALLAAIIIIEAWIVCGCQRAQNSAQRGWLHGGVIVQRGMAQFVGQREAAQRLGKVTAEPDRIALLVQVAKSTRRLIVGVKCRHIEAKPGHEFINGCAIARPRRMFIPVTGKQQASRRHRPRSQRIVQHNFHHVNNIFLYCTIR